MNYIDTLLTSAMAEVARMQLTNKNLAEDNAALRQANHDYHEINQKISKELTEVKELQKENKFMKDRLQWLLDTPAGNFLSYWQQLVIREALQGHAGVVDGLTTTPPAQWGWTLGGYAVPPAVFGGSTYNLKYDSVPVQQPKSKDGESLGQKIDRLKAYLLRHARENNKRAEHLENNAEMESEMRSSYFHSGKGEAYANAHKKVQEILG